MSSSNQGEGGYEMGSSSLRSDLKFLLVAFCLVVVLGLFFWRLHKLTVSARPQDMMPISSVNGKAALRQRDLSALPMFVHCEASADTAPGVECAVCLAVMRDGERGRLLPGCGHRFHVECIDQWFRTNSTCPLCRASVVGQTDAVEANNDDSVAAPVILVQA